MIIKKLLIFLVYFIYILILFLIIDLLTYNFNKIDYINIDIREFKI